MARNAIELELGLEGNPVVPTIRANPALIPPPRNPPPLSGMSPERPKLPSPFTGSPLPTRGTITPFLTQQAPRTPPHKPTPRVAPPAPRKQGGRTKRNRRTPYKRGQPNGTRTLLSMRRHHSRRR